MIQIQESKEKCIYVLYKTDKDSGYKIFSRNEMVLSKLFELIRELTSPVLLLEIYSYEMEIGALSDFVKNGDSNFAVYNADDLDLDFCFELILYLGDHDLFDITPEGLMNEVKLWYQYRYFEKMEESSACFYLNILKTKYANI